jgi:hypothetical protein
MDIVFQRKKTDSNRVKGVGVLSILTKVKNAKKGNFDPNCINICMNNSTHYFYKEILLGSAVSLTPL